MKQHKIKILLCISSIVLLCRVACAPSISQRYDQTDNQLNVIVTRLYRQSFYADALEPQTKLLEIKENKFGPNHQITAVHLNRLGLLYLRIGNFKKAEELISRSLEIREKILGPEHTETAYSLHNLGRIFEFTGDLNEAERLYQRSLEIRKKRLGPNAGLTGTNIADLGVLYKKKGDFARAESAIKQAGDILINAYGRNHANGFVRTNQLNLASLYISEGKPDKALNIIMNYNAPQGIGACYLAKKNYKKAIGQFQLSMKTSIRKGTKRSIAKDHLGIALSYEGLGNFESAKHHFKEAITIFEAQWVMLGYSRKKNFLRGDIGLSFRRIDAYEGIIRVIINQKKKGYKKEAFMYFEKLKSRTFLEMLTAKRSEGFAKEDEAIFTKDGWFQSQILLLQHKANAEKLLHETIQEYEQFINEIKLKDIELASLITVEVTPIEKIQSMLDGSTTVLEYFVARDKTYIWVITRNNIAVAEINYGELNLISLVNGFLLPNISNRSRGLNVTLWDSEDGSQIKETGERERLSNRKRFLKNAKEIYHILIKPVERFIQTKRLIITPHGVLHKVPFSGLHSGTEFMVEKYSISMIPSTSVLEHLIKRKKENNNKRFLSFANPQTKYIPLNFAEIEVENISKFFNNKEVYFRSTATESKVKSIANRPDIIHFACHGVFNDKHPMQSGLLMTEDHKNDGNLQVHEIFGLDLKGSSIVVLSACETAIGIIFGGDDLVGLTWGFFYAGT